MSGRFLYILNKNKTEKFLIEQDRIIIGRDKKCDIFLDDSEISRKHAAILNKFGVIYVENISSTGQILLDNNPIEFAELSAKKKFTIGPFTLYWDDGAEASDAPKKAVLDPVTSEPLADLNAQDPESNDLPQEVQGEEINAEINNEAQNYDSPQGEMEIPQLNEDPPLEEIGEMEKGEQGTAAIMGALQNGDPAEGNEEQGLTIDEPESKDSSSGVSAAGSTQIVDSQLPAILKMTKGDSAGKEYKLEDRVEWVVGRGSKNEIQIESQKISRQHFKILRVGPGFRIQDLGSSNGTKVNGVSITESPLSSFDTIQAGQIEFQFLIGSPEKNTGSGMSAALGIQNDTHSNQRSVNPGADSGMALISATQQGASPLNSGQNDATLPGVGAGQFPMATSAQGNVFGKTKFTRLGLTGAAAQRVQAQKGFFSSQEPKTGRQSLVQKFKELPPQRRVLFILIFLILAGFLAQGDQENGFSTDLARFFSGDDSTIQVAEAPKNPTSEDISNSETGKTENREVASTNQGISVTTTPLSNAPKVSSTEASPDYFALSDAEKLKIEENYQKALAAQNNEKWNEAYDFANQVRAKVKKYKSTTEIIFNAQNQLNEDSLGSISQAAGSAEEAQANNSEILSVSLAEGEKALREQRWSDAKENFNRALILDPSNLAAKMGLEKALAEDLGADVKTPDVNSNPNSETVAESDDPNQVRKDNEKDYLQSLKTKYQDARNKINSSSFGRALRLLKELDNELKSKVDEFNDAVRTPASVKNEMMEDTRVLLTKVKEASDLARTQLLAEYQTQLTDAEEMTTNKQYIQAREIYDRILKVEPDFEDVRESRNKLYSKIVVEAKNAYQEGLIYESVGDLEEAKNGYMKSIELLTNVRDPMAQEYLRKADERYSRIKQ
jgi:pSer/pThr/pTyr-binding forkhead associated (FHA) protein